MSKNYVVEKGFYAFIDEALIEKGVILKAKSHNIKDKTFLVDKWIVHESWIKYWINMGYIKECK